LVADAPALGEYLAKITRQIPVLTFTAASMVGAVNSVFAGARIALLVRVAGMSAAQAPLQSG